MKLFLALKTALLFFVLTSSAQLTTHFTCPGGQVVAYKIGTSCTAASFKFYTLTSGGVQSSTAFYTITATDREVNGLGINSVDQYLYGIEYDRSTSCTFSNFHLMRYDAAGHKQDLGIVPVMSGGTVQAALGCVSLEGNFIYSVNDASGNRYIAQIKNIASLAPSAGTLTVGYKLLTNNCAVATYADWAVDPTSGKLYSYGIYANGSVCTGTVMRIDPKTGSIDCIGTTNTTEFLDVTRDNFGGVYFSGGGILYGVNVNTRRLYRINVSTGALTFISTMSGSGQIRADLASCDNGSLVLPIHFTGVSMSASDRRLSLQWSTEGNEEISCFEVEAQQENGIFQVVANLPVEKTQTQYNYSLSAPEAVTNYRITAVTRSGKVYYSQTMKYQPGTASGGLRLTANPVVNHVAEIYAPASYSNKVYTVLDANGSVVKKGVFGATASATRIDLGGRPGGLYFLQTGQLSSTLKILLP
jgi:hypothetical protein